MACGPDIRKDYEVKSDLSILDIAPTILHMFGCRVPREMDGKVLEGLFAEDSDIPRVKVRYSRKRKQRRKGRRITGDEERKIRERLRVLGYLDHKH